MTTSPTFPSLSAVPALGAPVWTDPMLTTNHLSTKRRNLARWMVNRLRRLEWEIARGRNTPRQMERACQLGNDLQRMGHRV